MADAYFSDQEGFVSQKPLPSPSDTPYHSLSRGTPRYGSTTDVESSPPPSPLDPLGGSDNIIEEKISILDPRRFTPTLHNNLVSEILNLRRELDLKHGLVVDVETKLHTSRSEKDGLSVQLSSITRENRTLKRQLQQLENGTLSALEELASERDKATESNADLKEKAEAMQKKLREQEEDSTRVHDMWAREKEEWAAEKRTFERRVYVSESRVKLLLDEFSAQEAAREEDGLDSEGEDMARDGVGYEDGTESVLSSPQRRPSTRTARHSRNLSNGSFRTMSRHAYRLSLLSLSDGRPMGLSLADELTFDEEEEDLGELELDSDDFPENEMRARRALESRLSLRQDEKAIRVLGLSLEEGPVAPAESDTTKIQDILDSPSVAIAPHEMQLVLASKALYVDCGVQYSPPPSPVQPEFTQSIESAISTKPTDPVPSMAEIEANQSRKRVSVPADAIVELYQALQERASMTSASTQTVDQPLSPPATPKMVLPTPQSPVLPMTPTMPEFVPSVVSVSAETQTIQEPVVTLSSPPTRAPPPVPITVPSIAIHAPTSAPPSPREPILPPGTKSIATQTVAIPLSDLCSVGTQTDPIRIDTRGFRLPPHLRPSSISSRPGTPQIKQDHLSNQASAPQGQSKNKGFPLPSARQDLTALLEKAANQKIEDRYPGNNDNGPLAPNSQESILTRPFRVSSLFAGFDGPSSDEEELDMDLSDDDFSIPRYSTPMLSSRNMKSGRIFSSPPTPVPEDQEVSSVSRPSQDSITSTWPSERSYSEKSAKITKLNATSLSRQPNIRRSAMIHNGTNAHMRSRSPSIGSVNSGQVTKPPFQIPTRSSSRPILSKSDGSQSPTPRGGGAFGGRRPYGIKQQGGLQHKDSLRKVRSAAVIAKAERTRSRSPSLPSTPVLPLSPELPPLPTDLVSGHKFGHRRQLSRQISPVDDASVGSAAYQASVVDAIAATMVGEWMWKYVRKRKGFGAPESSPAEIAAAATGEEAAILASHGVRHKRWVWISPYERAVLWSSKQPTSSSALLGKSGRKLTIQSVLDVADNTPIPRNAGAQPMFNRSILILTPARALKFTATSSERHYLWLTALSFLAHSTTPVPEIAPMLPGPPPREENVPHKPSGAILRLSHVRDSVRLAKDKANPVTARLASRLEPMPDLYPRQQHVPDPVPSIPRAPFHGRKRSSTGPGAPPPSIPFRSFSNQSQVPSHQQVPSLYSSASSDVYNRDGYNMQPPSVPSSVYNPHSVVDSTRTSEASTSTGRNFFDSMGTVRMEAFIDNSLNHGGGRERVVGLPGFAGFGGLGGVGGVAIPRARVPNGGAKRRERKWSGSSANDPHRAGGCFDEFAVPEMSMDFFGEREGAMEGWGAEMRE